MDLDQEAISDFKILPDRYELLFDKISSDLWLYRSLYLLGNLIYWNREISFLLTSSSNTAIYGCSICKS